jgi:hypothetical protein
MGKRHRKKPAKPSVWTAETAQQQGVTVRPTAPAPVAAGSPATAIQTALRPAAAPLSGTPTRARPGGVWGHIKGVLTPIASLRLTVWLFALAVLLVFFGTLALVDQGLDTVLHKYFRAWVAWIPGQALVRFGQKFFDVSKTAEVSWSFPFPGGWLLGAVLLVNLLAAHAVRFKINWKRSGILILHAGLVIIMVNELITGLFAVENRMIIEKDHSKNYLEDHREVELAIIDPSNPQTDDVVVIPGSLLRKGGLIRHDDLPFDVQVVRYMVNSSLVPASTLSTKEQEENPATAGDGRDYVALKRPEVPGARSDKEVDIPAVYVTFKKKGSEESLGTYLTTTLFSNYWMLQPPEPERPQHVALDGKTYSVFLRSKRTYTAYTVHLLEFKHEFYEGTSTPKNFSSKVRVEDPARGEDREALIYMNNPLPYRGETFYQSSFLPGDKGTILQVVRNPGSQLPYLACAMVSLGMLVHFGLHLVSFLRVRMAK